MKAILPLLAVLFGTGLGAHPMGNFSVSHYAKLVVTARGVELTYALDLAEIPTFELLREWNLDRNAPRPELDRKAEEQARDWLKNITITVDGKPGERRVEQVKLVVADGAGNLPIVRITTLARINGSGAKLEYEDHNFAERAGWKEIVVDAGPRVTFRHTSQSNADISQGLTHYPPDPTTAPPQDLRAEAEWTLNQTPVANTTRKKTPPVVIPIPQPKIAPAATSPALMTKQAAPAGTVVRGDFLSRLMKQRQLTTWMIMAAMGAAFLLGAAHALTPGHGKTIVAAYLVGSRGTLKHAAFLGAMVTFTHTISVFALGLATLFLFRYVAPEKLTQVLGAVSGISIVLVGARMLWKRAHHAGHSHYHHHDHPHTHDHHHHHEHPHSHDHHHDHAHPHTHSHEVHHEHSHVPERISWPALVALGASGGLAPCESALVLLLGAIALGRVGLGLALLVCFSLGLALVLMTIGVLVLYAKNLIPERKRDSSRGWLRWISIASPAVVIVIGLIMTGVSLGWIRPQWGVG